MKTWIVMALATAGGVAAGLASSWYEFAGVVEDFTVRNVKVEQRDGPRVDVEGGVLHDFGLMERYGKRTHTFVFKNVGTLPLTLEKGETSCKCTLGDVEQALLQPGESTRVTLEWTAKEVGPTPQFEQSAEILTNDPSRQIVRLTIRGEIAQSVRFIPGRLVLSSLLASSPAEHSFRVYSYLNDNLEVESSSFQDETLAERMEVTFRPLTTEELGEEPQAKSGLLGTLRVSAGLPVGEFSETLQLVTNLPDSPRVHLPIIGSVSPDIIVTGRGYDRRTGTLDVGRVPTESGATAELQVLVKGPYREQIKFQLIENSAPNLAQWQAADFKPVNAGTALKGVWRIRLAPGMRPTEQPQQIKLVIDPQHEQLEPLALVLRYYVPQPD